MVPWRFTYLSEVLVLLSIGTYAPYAVQAQDLAIIQGDVVDIKGMPLGYANVQIVGTTNGAITESDGSFRFTTRHFEKCTLRATYVGFEPTGCSLHLSAGDTVIIRLVLRKTLIELGEKVVTASSYTTGENGSTALSSNDVVTTPGAAADILRAIKTLPGVMMVDEGAGLFVRGGDVSETVILLDQATITHPYKYESPTGGVFGTISPFVIKGTVFSTGGFPARYGNALSAVLAMDSQDLIHQTRYTLNLGLAAGSLGLHQVVVPEKIGLRLTGNLSFTDLLFRVNRRQHDFSTPPRSHDGNLNLVYQYSQTGKLKLFTYNSFDQLGVRVVEPSFRGQYQNRTNSWLYNFQWTEIFNGWFIQTSASLNHYTTRRQLGNLDLKPGELTAKFRVDSESELNARATLRFGTEFQRIGNRFIGTVPFRGGIFDPQAEVLVLNTSYDGILSGTYFEVDSRLRQRIAVNAGFRFDHHTLAGRFVVDPRFAGRFQISKGTELRVAWGIYHQFPAPYKYNPTSGNPDLGPQFAQHLVAGLSHSRGNMMMRLEAYNKRYRKLILEHPDLKFSNGGAGRASGVDLFVKYGGFLQTRFSGWLAYSLLRSRRLQVRHLGYDVRYEEAPSPFDVTHNLNVVGKMRLVGALSGGITLKHATGRPATPITGAIPVEGESYHLPIEGRIGSERYPTFRRIDASLSYVLPFGQQSYAVFYTTVNNLLDRANVLEYEYSIDYAERRPRSPNFRRSIYFGATFNIYR